LKRFFILKKPIIKLDGDSLKSADFR